jgi:hypothetical protein
MENIMTKSNTQTNAIPSYELIAESIINEWNLASLDTPDRQFNQASGEENVYYNSDVTSTHSYKGDNHGWNTNNTSRL